VIQLSTEQIKELEQSVKRAYHDLIEYKNEERKILFNVESLYEQINFMRAYQEKWGFIIIKNDKIQRIQATEEDNEGDLLG
jgi:hypothetical protein